MSTRPRYSSTFIFETRRLDDRFAEVRSVYGDPALGLVHVPDGA